MLSAETEDLETIDNMVVDEELRSLFSYLIERGHIVQLQNRNPDHLRTFSRQVRKMIAEGDPAWAEHVPAEVASVIRRRGLFGCEKSEPVCLPSGTMSGSSDVLSSPTPANA
jgi:hypothetical protein